ncbi:MAG: MFS transporter, partial [Gloeomargaritaceae cyanobacterium C42_A2020_066]|nr:MFS transporter [Gloeomargaritaceae cyanobacterium C42_A2020_066]
MTAAPPQHPNLGPMPPKPGLLTVLRNRDFLALWLSQVLSQLADKIYLVLTIAIITDYFQRPGESINGWVGAVMVVFTIPAVFLGSVAGVYVDRWQKRTVLMATNLLRGLLILALPAGLWVGQALLGPAGGFIALLITTFAISTLTQFFAPAEQAAIPLIIPAGQLIPANSLYTTSMMGALIIGFAVGEPLLALANHLLPGQNGPEWVVATAYLLAGFTILGVRTGEKPHPRHDEPLHLWQDLREGFSLLQKQPRLRVAVVLLVILFSVFAALAFLAVRLAEVMPELNTAQFGYLLAVAGLGMGVGAAILSQNHREPQGGSLYRLGFLGMAICLL